MTLDDESSVYVGGLAYDATEDSLRKAFEEYGSIVAVKVIRILISQVISRSIVSLTGDRHQVKQKYCCVYLVGLNEANIYGSNFHFEVLGIFSGKAIFQCIVQELSSSSSLSLDIGILFSSSIQMLTSPNFCALFKIIFDRESGSSRGYGFVTFTNPRSAGKAINGMDGQMMGGRTIRVNEVTNRNGRQFGRDNAFRDRDRDRDNRDFRVRDRTGNARQFSPQRNRRLSPGTLHSARGGRLPARHPSRSPQGGYSPSRSHSPLGRRNHQSSPSPSPRSSDRVQGADVMPMRNAKLGRRAAKERGSDLTKIKDELEKANQRRDELSIKVASLEEENELKDKEIRDLQSKSQKLEAAFSSVVSASSQRQIQLRKLHKAFAQVREYTERLKHSEKELQGLIDLSGIEINGAVDEPQENHAGNVGVEPDDMEWKADDGGHINIDD